MTLRSLLLGSAAAFVAVSGARAADAVVIAEPEPVEYVRVCDAFGAGYYYIPGTETCVKFSGYVYFQVGAEGYDGYNSPDFLTYGTLGALPDGTAMEDGWVDNVRGRFEVDARSSTEWGTLRGFIRFDAQTNGENADAAFLMNNGFLQLGGFRAGYTESVWVDSYHAGAASYGSHSWGSLSYGDQKRQQISYTYGEEEGFAATISLEDGSVVNEFPIYVVDEDGNVIEVGSEEILTSHGYMPDVVATANYKGDWGAVWARIGYDHDRNNGLDGTDGSSGLGVMAGLQYNIPRWEGSSLRVLGFYANSDNAYGTISPAMAYFGGYGTSKWSVIGSYYQQFTETFGASVGFQWFDDYYEAFSDVGTDLDGYTAEIALVWTPIDNFEVRTEVYYDKIEDLDGTASGFLRFTRFF